MIPAAFAPVAAHLWQSTLFAAAAGLLTLALRSNQARVRHWLWMAASYKFLVPFSWLVSIGQLFPWRTAPQAMPAAFSVFTDAVSGPVFMTSSSVATPGPAHAPGLTLPLVIGAFWACGFVAVVAVWLREWMRIHAIARAASPVPIQLPIPVVSTPARLEPGVFGVFRPVLLLPEGIAERLTPGQLAAILGHELCHVRRRDNLTATIHMLVEALFWFHPLVWWLGARMIDERERACDEEVLQAGGEPEAYAESILKVCEFYLESPLACLSGVTGSDLKMRMRRIMKNRFGAALSGRKKLLLAAAGLLTLAAPLVAGVLTAPRLPGQSPTATADLPKFEVASVRLNRSGNAREFIQLPPGRFVATAATTKTLIEFAYNIDQDSLLSRAPGWVNGNHYDVDAKEEDSAAKELEKLTGFQRIDRIRLMLQSLLASRFQLQVSHQTKNLPVYELAIAKGGPRLTPSTIGTGEIADANPPGQPRKEPRIGMTGRGEITATDVPLSLLVEILAHQLGRQVVDKSGLTGNYDFTLHWTPDESQLPGVPDSNPNSISPNVPPSDSSGLSIFTAIQEQLGLRLEAAKGPVDVLVIDHIEEPSPNSEAQVPGAAVAAPVAANAAAGPGLQAQSPAATSDRPRYDVVSIKLNKSGSPVQSIPWGNPGGHLSATNMSIRFLIITAYGIDTFPWQTRTTIVGIPDSIESEHFDIEAEKEGSPSEAEKRLMIQAILTDRFKFAMHHETRQLPVYALVAAKGGKAGPQLQAHKDDPKCLGPDSPSAPLPPPDSRLPPPMPCRDMIVLPGPPAHLAGAKVTLATLAQMLSFTWGIDRTVVDRTGLAGIYDLRLGWSWMPQSGSYSAPDPGDPPDIFTAVQEQLGLKLEPATGPVDVMVVDHLEEPSPN